VKKPGANQSAVNQSGVNQSGDLKRVVTIGIAGGIGAGKSLVAEELAFAGCVVSDSDAQSREVLRQGAVRDELVRWWGKGILGSDGQVDRGRVGAIVFGDGAERKRLESLIHPMLVAGRDALRAKAAATGALAFVIDAPLLFEAGLDGECDAVIFVDSTREKRLRRVKSTRGWTEEELTNREAAQWPLDDKRKRCAYSVMNQGDRADVQRQVRATLGVILAEMAAQGGSPRPPIQ